MFKKPQWIKIKQCDPPALYWCSTQIYQRSADLIQCNCTTARRCSS